MVYDSATQKDCGLIRRAIRERWPVPDEYRHKIADRLMEVIEKRTVDVPMKDGVFPSEAVADANAIAASKTFVAMAAQNQKDDPVPVEHHHTHEIGPVTADNLAEYKRRALAELDREREDAGRVPSGDEAP